MSEDMFEKKRAGAKSWCWRPLRARDVIADYEWGRWMDHNKYDNGCYASRLWSCRPYERLIPERALRMVAKIETKFGDRVKFFVSDYVAPKVDPFIMVRPAMCDSGPHADYTLIFDVWDEPGFGV